MPSWNKVNERYRSLHPHTVAVARLSQALQDLLSALRQGDGSLGMSLLHCVLMYLQTSNDSPSDALLDGLSSEEKHLVTSDVTFLARADRDTRARLVIQASNGFKVLQKTGKTGLNFVTHVGTVLDCLGMLLNETEKGKYEETPLATQMARSYVLKLVVLPALAFM